MGHVLGARNIRLGNLPAHLVAIPHDRPLAISWRPHHRGSPRNKRAAALLRAAGFRASAE